jgi:hypothetical protein
MYTTRIDAAQVARNGKKSEPKYEELLDFDYEGGKPRRI